MFSLLDTDQLTVLMSAEGGEETKDPPQIPSPLALSDDFKGFLVNPLPKDTWLQCTVRRHRKWFNALFPKYTVTTEQGQLLLSARKMAKHASTHYYLSMSEDHFSRADPNFVGKLRSNFSGSEYALYKSDVGRDGKMLFGVFLYESKATIGPKQVIVLMPVPAATQTVWSVNHAAEVVQQFRTHDRGSMTVLCSKRPLWVGGIGPGDPRPPLDVYGGRVTQHSVKNFQIVDPTDLETVLLQAGKKGKNEFALDFRYPFSPAQAFALALSSYDFKLT